MTPRITAAARPAPSMVLFDVAPELCVPALRRVCPFHRTWLLQGTYRRHLGEPEVRHSSSREKARGGPGGPPLVSLLAACRLPGTAGGAAALAGLVAGANGSAAA